MASAVPKISYPEPDKLSLWNTSVSKRDRLRIINEEDFPREEILNSLGLSKGSELTRSFGITDEDELRARHSLGAMLLGDDDFMDWSRQNRYNLPNIPTGEAEFLEFYDPQLEHNPYWAEVHSFLSFVDNYPDPPARLKQVADKLREGLPLEEMETEMARQIAERLKVVTVIEGVMHMILNVEQYTPTKTNEEGEKVPTGPTIWRLRDVSHSNSRVFGHRLYSQGLSSVRMMDDPDWVEGKWNPLRWIGFGKCVRGYVGLRNWWRRRKAYRQMVITGQSKAMIRDIGNAIKRRIEQVPMSDKFSGAMVTVSFVYNKDGLKVQIMDIKSTKHFLNDEQRREISLGVDNFEGYTSVQKQQIERAHIERRQAAMELQRCQKSDTLRLLLAKVDTGFFNSLTAERSPEMDRDYRWFAITNELHGRWVDLYNALRQNRGFFARHFYRLNEVAELVSKVADKGKELGVPICSPEIVSNGHIVVFEKLWPTHLLFRLDRKSVVPIERLPELNGQMIGLTGKHGGGKTETQIAVVANIYLAHSGVPVFGSYFKSNVKKVLGMVFIAQRGEGSTCEMLLAKIRKVLEGIKKYDGKEVVLVLDEVGSATQEVAGFELGRDLLSTLAGRNVSVLFSTQITSLAEYADTELGALSFQMDRKHKIATGIGDGGMTDLRRSMGVDKFLTRVAS